MKRSLETYFLNTLFVSPQVNTDLLWNFTLIFVILCALYFGFIFFFRNKLSYKTKAIEKRKKELTPLIVKFLFYDENSPEQEKTDYVNLKVEIRDLINNAFNRKVLIDILMYLRKDLSGATLSKLFKLYQELGLHHDSYKKLKSWKWQNISKGILELTQMNVEDSYVFIRKFINDKRATIRKQAEVAIITLKSEGLNYFLDTTTYRISEWQQLKILEVLINKKNYLPPSFNHWLMSKNNDVVLFSLRLMKNYNQTNGNEALIELLKHKNSEIKIAAMSCIKEFHVVEALENLKLVFWDSKIDVKIGILDVIGSLGTENEMTFLKSVVAKESNFNVKSKSLACMNIIQPMSVLPTIDIQATDVFTNPKDLPISETEENYTTNKSNTTFEHQKVRSEENIIPDATTPEHTYNSVNLPKKEIAEIDNVLDPYQMEVKYEVIASKKFNSVTFKKDIQTKEEFNLEFLPLIVSPIEKPSSKYNPHSKLKVNAVITDLEVVFNELNSASNTMQKEMDEVEFSVNKLSKIVEDFLPLVIPITDNTVCSSQANESINYLDLSVIYNEILISTNTKQEAPTINNIDMKDIRNIECDVNEIKITKLESSTIEASDIPEIYKSLATESNNEKSALEWVLSENEARLEMKQKLKSIMKEQDEVSFKLPKPIFYNEREANTMALLDDIEVLGDSREIVLLHELLKNETEITISERIEYLIFKLKGTEVLKRKPIKPNNKIVSVFEKNFSSMALPSQLIMLDEIALVGDEKEIPFLRRLIAVSSGKVADKAEKCLGQILVRLNTIKQTQENLNAPNQDNQIANNKYTSINDTTVPLAEDVIEKIAKKPFNVFDIDFEIDLDEKDSKGAEK
ncbi:hypothetical protein GH721_02505 [Kriegella sp. EG-1]|nr:hypothetical protein [Flavobacteriaceae bacterium EG-1]